MGLESCLPFRLYLRESPCSALRAAWSRRICSFNSLREYCKSAIGSRPLQTQGDGCQSRNGREQKAYHQAITDGELASISDRRRGRTALSVLGYSPVACVWSTVDIAPGGCRY